MKNNKSSGNNRGQSVFLGGYSDKCPSKQDHQQDGERTWSRFCRLNASNSGQGFVEWTMGGLRSAVDEYRLNDGDDDSVRNMVYVNNINSNW